MKNLIKPFVRGLVRNPQLTSSLLLEVGCLLQSLVKLEDYSHPLCLSSTFQKYLGFEAEKFFKTQKIDNTCRLYKDFLESDDYANVRLYPNATTPVAFWYWCKYVRKLKEGAIIKNLTINSDGIIVSIKNDNDDKPTNNDDEFVDAEFETATTSLLKPTKVIRRKYVI